MAIVALIGPPGAGKTVMVCKTAVRRPVHVVDIDRKIKAMAILRDLVTQGQITYKEIGETVQEDSIARRLDALVKNEKPTRPPRGWTNLANYVGSFENEPIVKSAGTILIDSYTQMALHLRAHIQYLAGRSKFEWNEWSVWKSIWGEATTTLVDYALAYDKDLIITVHERVSEVPGEGAQKVLVKQNPKGGTTREYVGAMNVRIAASIEGAFGLEFGTYFTDVYRLFVKIEGGQPQWRCRVLPDGQRDLRCSFDVGHQAEWEPDFAKIWGPK